MSMPNPSVSRRWMLEVHVESDVDAQHFGPYTEAEVQRVYTYLRGRCDAMGYVEGDPPYLWVTELRPFSPREDEFAITGDERVMLADALGLLAGDRR